MGLNSRYVTCAIFGKTKDSGRKFLLRLVKDIPVNNIRRLAPYELFLDNGYHCVVISVEGDTRGYRYEKAYVEIGIGTDALESKIKPYFSNDFDIEYFE